MLKRDFEKMTGLYVIALLLTLSVMLPLNLFGQESSPKRPNRVEIKDGRVSADVQEAAIADVLKEIEQGTGLKITGGEKLAGQKVTAQFEGKDIADSLREILRGYYFVLSFTYDPTNKEKKSLKEVKAGDAAIGSKLLERPIITKEIAYGKKREDVGSVDKGEGALTGPQSFAIGDKGDIYVCDTVNKRVQVFSPYGNYLATIPLGEGIFAEDIVVDQKEYVYIYDRLTARLYQYEKNGNIVTSVDVDESRWGGYGGDMHIIDDEIYMYVCDSKACGDFIIGRVLSDNVLIVPSGDAPKRLRDPGRQGLSGKKYVAGFKRFEEGNIEIKEKNGATSKTVVFSLRGILSTRFLGDDSKGNAYVKIERDDENKKLMVDVHNFDKDGNYLNTFQMPASNTRFWSAKNLLVSKEGAIYQFLPEKDKLTINIFPSKANQ